LPEWVHRARGEVNEGKHGCEKAGHPPVSVRRETGMEMTPSDKPRARVFISCGQSKGTDEEATASAIASRLERLGFDPYVAVQEQTLRGLKENIFEQLATSEYYIFVDFKRDELAKTDPPVCRGSLFSHQEFALASYLDIPLLAFQELGVKRDDGIIRFLQANAISFTDRRLLPNVIADKVQERRWDPHWRNELVLERELGQFSDAQVLVSGDTTVRHARFFHINVQNRHRSKIARNCYVYLVKATDLNTAVEIPLKTAEFKWAGYVLPNAHILPRQARRFDAFHLLHDQPTRPLFNVFSDATDYIPHIEGEGLYQLTYSVVADDFPASDGSFILNLNRSLDLTTFKHYP
jgi:hypothetical protein